MKFSPKVQLSTVSSLPITGKYLCSADFAAYLLILEQGA